jgi:hypothetical protein
VPGYYEGALPDLMRFGWANETITVSELWHLVLENCI